MATLTREAIVAVRDIQRELVDVPEWGGEVWVRGLTAAERDAYESGMVKNPGPNQEFVLDNIRAKLAVKVICDENGARLFSDADVALLAEKSGSALSRVWMVARRLSGMTEEAAAALTEQLKNAHSASSLSS